MAEQAPSGQGQTALITGASSGIGYELARCFARDGYRLVLVALPTDQIPQAEQRLRSEFPSVDLQFLPIDLSRAEGPYQVLEATRGQQIDVLVNDAGYGQHGFFAETDLAKELSMISLNVAALVALTKLFLPGMLERRNGRILQVGSVAGFVPNPLLAVYGATKAFVNSFAEAVQNELQNTGVTMTLLCPPATDTNFFQVADMEGTKEVQDARQKGTLRSAEDVAKDGYKALLKGDVRVMSGSQAKMQPFMASMLPDTMLASQTRSKLEDAQTKAAGKPSAAKARQAVAKAKPAATASAAASGPAPGGAAPKPRSRAASTTGTDGNPKPPAR